MAEYEHVAISRADDVVEIRFHTGDGPLTWTAAAHRELPDAFAEVCRDLDAKVVIVRGTGDAFCEEFDTESFRQAGVYGGRGWDVIWWEGKRLLHDLLAIDVPVIGVVNGAATVHAEIPVLADLVIASDRATFQDSRHFQRGGVPGDGVHLVWPHLIGQTRANYFLMTGQVLSAAEALQLGVVNEVVPHEQVVERAWDLARAVAERPQPVLRYTRDALNIGRRELIGNALSHGLAVEGLGAAVAAAAREAAADAGGGVA